jgi:prolipoprotein diacylglyceryltransferase
VPVLVGIVLGKLAMAIGGRGQGTPTDGAWATAYVGAGPWASLGPSIPSHPSQVYEAIGTFVVLLAVIVWRFARRGKLTPDGTTFLLAIAGWAAVRAVVASTWRDASLVGPLNAEQLICLATAVGCAALASQPRWSGRWRRWSIVVGPRTS